MINTDGNLAALADYEREQEQQEQIEEAFISAVDEDMKDEIDDLYSRFTILCNQYEMEYDFIEYIKEII